jgi:hypothetical protein
MAGHAQAIPPLLAACFRRAEAVMKKVDQHLTRYPQKMPDHNDGRVRFGWNPCSHRRNPPLVTKKRYE